MVRGLVDFEQVRIQFLAQQQVVEHCLAVFHEVGFAQVAVFAQWGLLRAVCLQGEVRDLIIPVLAVSHFLHFESPFLF